MTAAGTHTKTVTAESLRPGHSLTDYAGISRVPVISVHKDGRHVTVSTHLGHAAYYPDETVTVCRY